MVPLKDRGESPLVVAASSWSSRATISYRSQQSLLGGAGHVRLHVGCFCTQYPFLGGSSKRLTDPDRDNRVRPADVSGPTRLSAHSNDSDPRIGIWDIRRSMPVDTRVDDSLRSPACVAHTLPRGEASTTDFGAELAWMRATWAWVTRFGARIRCFWLETAHPPYPPRGQARTPPSVIRSSGHPRSYRSQRSDPPPA